MKKTGWVLILVAIGFLAWNMVAHSLNEAEVSAHPFFPSLTPGFPLMLIFGAGIVGYALIIVGDDKK